MYIRAPSCTIKEPPAKTSSFASPLMINVAHSSISKLAVLLTNKEARSSIVVTLPVLSNILL